MRDAETTAATQRNRPTAPTHLRDEIARLGKAIYERDIRRQVEDRHVGEVVSIDVDTGSWAIADDLLAAADSLRAQRPNAVNIWSERVGYRALASFGGGSITTPLVGMRLLDGYDLNIQVKSGGRVAIQPTE